MPQVPISPGVTGSSMEPSVHVVGERAAQHEGFAQDTVSLEVEDVVFVDGFPALDTAGGAAAVVTGLGAFTQVTSPPDPATLFPEAYAHWVPREVDLAVPANGGRRWWPVGSPKTEGSPRISLYTLGGTNGEGTYNTNAPQIQDDYVFQGFGRNVQRPAMVWDNGTGRAKIDPEGVFPSVTLAMTVVLHPSPLSYYGLFEANWDEQPGAQPLVLRYHHGQLRLYQQDVWVLSHEVIKPTQGATVLIVALDSAGDVGRFYCLDANRTTRTFNARGLNYVSLLGSLGNLGQGTATRPYQRPAEMDLLDLVMWTEALSFAEMEAAANLLSLAYGVAS